MKKFSIVLDFQPPFNSTNLNPIVSIITPSFNRALLIIETADSIFSQSYPYWEWMIVDDGSTDNSWETLQMLSLRDSRIKIFQRQREPKGACTCRNIAVENSTGKYVLFLDTDDLLAPFCLEQRVKVMEENPGTDFAIFPMLLFEKRWDDLQVLWNTDDERDDLHRILVGDPICQGTGTLWRKASFQRVGLWREDLALWQDIELHIRSLLYPMRFVKRMDLLPDVYLRVTPNSLSRGGYYSAPKTKSRIKVLLYTAELMRTKGLSNQYKAELKNMALDIALSCILSGQFKQARVVLKLGYEYDLFDTAESKKINYFLLIRKFKLYKVNIINRHFLQSVNALSLPVVNNLGKVKWNGGPTLKKSCSSVTDSTITAL